MNSTIKKKERKQRYELFYHFSFFYNRMFGSTSLRPHRLIRNPEFDDWANPSVPQSISNCLVYFLFYFIFCVDKAHSLSKRIENFSTGTDGEKPIRYRPILGLLRGLTQMIQTIYYLLTIFSNFPNKIFDQSDGGKSSIQRSLYVSVFRILNSK